MPRRLPPNLGKVHRRRVRSRAPKCQPRQWPPSALSKLLAQVHNDEEGAVSIETVLIVAAISLPILIFVIKFGWPRVKAFFEKGMTDLEGGANNAGQGN